MSTTYSDTSPSPTVPGLVIIVPLLIVWSGLILTLALNGVFQATEGAPPIAVGTALLTPPALFLLAYRLLAPLRHWVASLDMIVVTAVQAWRVVGAAFVILWALGELPITFAAPAGLGDVAVGIFAVSVTVMVARRSAGWRAASWSLITVGLLDFVGAFGTAVLSGGGRLLDFANAPDPTMMQSAPMVMIPSFAVPLFIIFHLIAWIKLRTED